MGTPRKTHSVASIASLLFQFILPSLSLSLASRASSVGIWVGGAEVGASSGGKAGSDCYIIMHQYPSVSIRILTVDCANGAR
jgi:hypothetical protein